jgi:hypothetical protein
MTASSLIILIILSIFLFVYFWLTQKIYSNNYFKTLSILSIILIALFYLFITDKYKFVTLRFGFVFMYYFALLWSVRLFYKRINEKLISKNLIDISYKGKDFTYVWSDGEILADPWWDEKLAKNPSWLDHVITYMLGLLPLFLSAIPSI